MILEYKNKKCIYTFGFLAVLICICSFIYSSREFSLIQDIDIHCSFISYGVDDLANDSAMILVGSPIEEFIDRTPKALYTSDGFVSAFSTITNIKIDKIIKAPKDTNLKKNDDIKIYEPLAIIREKDGVKKKKYDGYDEMEKGKKYLIFLGVNSDGTYSVINLRKGRFDISKREKLDRDGEDYFRDMILDKFKNDIN